MESGDRGFFSAGWLRSFKARGTAVKAVHAQTVDHFQAHLISRLIRRSSVTMAVDASAPAGSDLLGFVCHENLRGTCLLHYLYVHGRSRGRGVGSALLAHALEGYGETPVGLVWTHRTSGFDPWVRGVAAKRWPKLPLLYNPYLLDPESH